MLISQPLNKDFQTDFCDGEVDWKQIMGSADSMGEIVQKSGYVG